MARPPVHFCRSHDAKKRATIQTRPETPASARNSVSTTAFVLSLHADGRNFQRYGMAKREFAHPNEMQKYVGQEIGVSDWVEVNQDRINQFTEATGDHQWIHVDVERAKKDMPGGKTIAHGFLTLSHTDAQP